MDPSPQLPSRGLVQSTESRHLSTRAACLTGCRPSTRPVTRICDVTAASSRARGQMRAAESVLATILRQWRGQAMVFNDGNGKKTGVAAQPLAKCCRYRVPLWLFHYFCSIGEKLATFCKVCSSISVPLGRVLSGPRSSSIGRH